MAGHAVLNEHFPMFGIDFHQIKLVPLPYVTFAPLSGLADNGSMTPTQKSAGGRTLNIVTDIGPAIPHVGVPAPELAIIILNSSSKSHFGAASYLTDGKTTAAASGVIVDCNLNCGTPPLPSGIVIALNTHVVGLTIGDLVAGFLAQRVDALIQSVIEGISLLLGRKVGSLLKNRAVKTLISRQAKRIENLVSPAFEWIVGSPMGIDVDNLLEYLGISEQGEKKSVGGVITEKIQEYVYKDVREAVDDYFNDPSIEHHGEGAK